VSVVLARFAPILELLARSHARLVIDVDPALSLAMDDTSLEQIVLNLVLNARDALVASGRTGTIKIEARRTPEGAVLSVSDDGPGFSSQVRAQLGHEYFTTKAHGTGLGLSVARKLAQAAHGRLEIPVTERGARVELHLPCA